MFEVLPFIRSWDLTILVLQCCPMLTISFTWPHNCAGCGDCSLKPKQSCHSRSRSVLIWVFNPPKLCPLWYYRYLNITHNYYFCIRNVFWAWQPSTWQMVPMITKTILCYLPPCRSCCCMEYVNYVGIVQLCTQAPLPQSVRWQRMCVSSWDGLAVSAAVSMHPTLYTVHCLS